MNLLKNNRGFTLIELLAAVLILSILSLSLFSFFIQASNYSTQNKNKLVAINLARGVVERLNDYTDIKESSTKGTFNYDRCISSGRTATDCTNYYTAIISNIEYSIEIIVEPTQIERQIDLTSYGGVNSVEGIGYPSLIRILSDTKTLAELGSVMNE
jgi:prepilin-type N-terminal cleavage/methylation domain-containing protein